jgi:hypothetical protein
MKRLKYAIIGAGFVGHHFMRDAPTLSAEERDPYISKWNER